MSVGTGSAHKGFSLKGSVQTLRAETGLSEAGTLRREGAPIPLKPLPRWDNGRDVVLAGDRQACRPCLRRRHLLRDVQRTLGRRRRGACDRDPRRPLAEPRPQAVHEEHGRVFWFSGCCNTSGTATINAANACQHVPDKDVQRLTWESYMNKTMPRRDPLAHVRSSSRILRTS